MPTDADSAHDDFDREHPSCDHGTYETDTCPSCVRKVYAEEMQRVIEERDRAIQDRDSARKLTSDFERILIHEGAWEDAQRRQLAQLLQERDRLKLEMESLRADMGLWKDEVDEKQADFATWFRLANDERKKTLALEAELKKLRNALEEAEDAFEQAIVDMDGPSRPGHTKEYAMKCCQQMCLQPALAKVREALRQ